MPGYQWRSWTELVRDPDQKRLDRERLVHRHAIGRRAHEEGVVKAFIVEKPIFEAHQPIVPEHDLDSGTERPARAESMRRNPDATMCKAPCRRRSLRRPRSPARRCRRSRRRATQA